MAKEIIPILHTQLAGGGTGGSDCGVMASAMAVAYGKGKRRGPNRKRMRQAMNKLKGPTNTAEQQKGVESFGVRYRRKVNAPLDRLVTALENGRWVNVQIDYSVVNARRPRLSGCRSFQGDHSVSVHGIRGQGPDREVRVFDPLYDGRASGVPDGPRWWPLALLRSAAEAFASDGHWTGGIVRSPAGKPLAQDDDLDADTLDQLRHRVDELEDLVGVLRASTEVMDDTLAALGDIDDPTVRTAVERATRQLAEIMPDRSAVDAAAVPHGAAREDGSVDEED